jgi:hypothetical protein
VYCPKCSQPQVSAEAQFCPRCGMALDGLKEMLEGRAPAGRAELSPRQKGVRHGALLMLLSLILIPASVLLAALFPANDRLVESSPSDTPFEKISQAVLITVFMLGLARVLYALLFQQGAARGAVELKSEFTQVKDAASDHELPPAQSVPASGFGAWRTDTGEMAEAPRARRRTTQSLDADG